MCYIILVSTIIPQQSRGVNYINDVLPYDLSELIYKIVHIHKMIHVSHAIQTYRKSLLHSSKYKYSIKYKVRSYIWVNLLIQIRDFEDSLIDLFQNLNLTLSNIDLNDIIVSYSNIPKIIYIKCCGQNFGCVIVNYIMEHHVLPPNLRKYLLYAKNPNIDNNTVPPQNMGYYIHKYGVQIYPTKYHRPRLLWMGAVSSWEYGYINNPQDCQFSDLIKSVWNFLDIEMDIHLLNYSPNCSLLTNTSLLQSPDSIIDV